MLVVVLTPLSPLGGPGTGDEGDGGSEPVLRGESPTATQTGPRKDHHFSSTKNQAPSSV